MNLEVGKPYIRKDFLYFAVILEISSEVVMYEFCNLKNGHKHKWATGSSRFKDNYSLATDLLTALF